MESRAELPRRNIEPTLQCAVMELEEHLQVHQQQKEGWGKCKLTAQWGKRPRDLVTKHTEKAKVLNDVFFLLGFHCSGLPSGLPGPWA